MADRAGQAGVTLIEMLAALAVSSLIGVAGFALLESVVNTEAGLAGRLDELAQRERAFQVLALDLSHAQTVEISAVEQIALTYATHRIEWLAGPSGLERRIIRRDRAAFVQTPLATPAQISVSGGVLKLALVEDDIRRLFALPQQVIP